MAIEATYDFKLKVVETLDIAQDLAANPEIVHELATLIRGKLDANSSVIGTKVWSDTRTLTAGADTIDLTALTGPNGAAITLNGLKVQLLLIAASASNTAFISLLEGLTNPYSMFGLTNGFVEIQIGGANYHYGCGRLSVVSTTQKNIRVTSADTDAVYSIIIVAG